MEVKGSGGQGWWHLGMGIKKVKSRGGGGLRVVGYRVVGVKGWWGLGLVTIKEDGEDLGWWNLRYGGSLGIVGV